MASISYKSRPPATARFARAVWDYCEKTHATPLRPLVEIYYSQNYMYDGPHWVSEIGMLDTDTMHFRFSRDALTRAYRSNYLKRLFADAA